MAERSFERVRRPEAMRSCCAFRDRFLVEGHQAGHIDLGCVHGVASLGKDFVFAVYRKSAASRPVSLREVVLRHRTPKA